MGISRRRFMRSAPAGVVAAPLAAKSLASELVAQGAVLPPNSAYMYAGKKIYKNDPSPMGHMAWLLNQKASLEESMKTDGGIQEAGINHDLVARHYDSLRSVSPVARCQMHRTEIARRDREEHRRWMSRDIDNIIKELAAL